VLGINEGKDYVFYALDLFRGKGDRIGAIEGWDFCSLSPDGSRVVVVRRKENKSEMEVLTISNHTWHEISVEPGWNNFGSVDWAANGNGFYVSSYSPNDSNLLYVTLAGKVKLLLHSGLLGVVQPLPSLTASTWRTRVRHETATCGGWRTSEQRS
jgi:Tol biopolymer transport system component